MLHRVNLVSDKIKTVRERERETKKGRNQIARGPSGAKGNKSNCKNISIYIV